MAVLKHPTFWAPRPKRPIIKRIINSAAPGAAAAGVKCYQQDGIVSAFIRRNLGWVMVNDGISTYQVVVPLEGFIRPHCPCLKGERTKMCQHGVAALLHITDEFDDLMQGDPWQYIRKTVESVSDKVIKTFLIDAINNINLDELEKNPRVSSKKWFKLAKQAKAATTMTDADIRKLSVMVLRHNSKARELFAARFGEPDLADHHECRAEMEYMFDEAAITLYPAPRVVLADFFNAAKARENREDMNEAILTYREISESILFNGSELEDEDNYYSSSFGKALKRMATCIRRYNKSDQRRPHIQYLHDRFIDDSYDWFHEKYKTALLCICANREDLEYLKGLHSVYMEKMRSSKFDRQHADIMRDMQTEISSRLAGKGSR